ncbi:Group XII secretory phospholipase A2 precursor (PLA2G12) [Seminavis robusta]|uniref:Group XII secretory phospholipase A2 (PLA2G12) n=1 Tax=Seminavis robusta TaxID=568900 RepID=A0A9N8E1D4_9STRA|nr:Group XII secretory phospholipase A2 precursor (PLA2G12) [Seminavis robusta]|eukprot:Sro449_g145360.1 Group XII secretory phospholipase A2 precursor (PLA2G12) (260) ;mRNA; r:45680-46459
MMRLRASVSLSLLIIVFLLYLTDVSAQKKKKKNKKKVDMGGLDDMLSALSGVAMQEKDGSCPSACNKKGLYPVPKRRLRPYSNGCSVPDSLRRQLVGNYDRVFDQCCDFHDACYQACGIHKPLCETDFQTCMQQTCQRRHDDDKSQCLQMAQLFVTGTTIFGCAGYHALQKESCECLPASAAVARVRDYTKQFHQAYNPKPPQTSLADPKALGEVIYRELYRPYPQSIDKIAHDGKKTRTNPSLIPPPKRRNYDDLDEL